MMFSCECHVNSLALPFMQLMMEQCSAASKTQIDEMNKEMQKWRNQVKELQQTLVKDARDWESERAQLVDQLQTVSNRKKCQKAS
jgi:thymidylate synthase